MNKKKQKLEAEAFRQPKALSRFVAAKGCTLGGEYDSEICIFIRLGGGCIQTASAFTLYRALSPKLTDG